MVEIKFIIEVVLVIVSIVVVVWWIYTNYSSLMASLQTWINDVLGWS